jgi:hypothetical protein
MPPCIRPCTNSVRSFSSCSVPWHGLGIPRCVALALSLDTPAFAVESAKGTGGELGREVGAHAAQH